MSVIRQQAENCRLMAFFVFGENAAFPERNQHSSNTPAGYRVLRGLPGCFSAEEECSRSCIHWNDVQNRHDSFGAIIGTVLTAGYTGKITADGVKQHGQLAVTDGQLVDSNGKDVQLRGMSTHGIAWYPEFIAEGAFSAVKSAGGEYGTRRDVYRYGKRFPCRSENKLEAGCLGGFRCGTARYVHDDRLTYSLGRRPEYQS